MLVRDRQAVAGVQISASHNPIEYNGLKLFNHLGRVIPAQEGAKVLDAYRQRINHWCGTADLGTIRPAESPHHAHLKAVLRTVDVDRIAQRRPRVLLDSNRGAGSLLGKLLLESLGCSYQILGDTPDGQFEHLPEPLAHNLESRLRGDAIRKL